jgi:hypothetical protein
MITEDRVCLGGVHTRRSVWSMSFPTMSTTPRAKPTKIVPGDWSPEACADDTIPAGC